MFPDTGFAEVYSEMYIQSEEKKHEDDSAEEEDQDIGNEPVPKKRGRKPKSFNIQKILDEQRQKEQICLEIDLKKEGTTLERTYDAINQPDESLGERFLEFQTHPLYKKLQGYSRELSDFIIQRKAF